MEKIFLILLSSLLLGASAGAKSPEDKEPRMTAEERAKTIKMLLDSQQEYLDALSNLTEAQWRFKPSPFQWSVGEVAEHILLTEIALFSSVEKALAQKPNPDWESKTAGKAEFIEKVVPSRSRRAQAPIEVRPSGKLSREEVVRRYKEARARTLEFTRTTDLPLKAHTFDHPFPVFNTLNAYDWLIYIPLHNIRHNQQIAEVKASAGYPKQPRP
jgi:uncharacterized damage-inducible protein DinB